MELSHENQAFGSVGGAPDDDDAFNKYRNTAPTCVTILLRESTPCCWLAVVMYGCMYVCMYICHDTLARVVSGTLPMDLIMREPVFPSRCQYERWESVLPVGVPSIPGHLRCSMFC